ncbi:putative F-box-like domain superfamily protein [Helianthus anomalus]
MVYLSFDMVPFEILTKLNARSIDRYKCVCRQWRHGLSSFEFRLLHSTYVENYLYYLRDEGFYVVNEYYAEFWPPEQLQKYDFLDEN